MRRFRMSVLSACVLSAALALLGCGGSSAVAPVAPMASAPATGVSVSSQAGARSLSFRIERLAGADRYAAAAAISREFQPGTSHWVVIASGELWSDGVAAGPVAAKLGAPVLFVTKYSVPKATAQELDRLRPSQILVLGGRATISDEVMVDLSAWTDEGAERLDGADRFAVAAKASAEVFTETVETAYVASGRVWPDALTGGAAAAVQGSPMLLTEPDRVPAAIATELRRLAPKRIFLLGGTASVDAGVAADLADIAPVERLWGDDRYDTALAISKRIFGTDRPAMMIATGANYPDALAGSAQATRTRGPILLSRRDTLPSGTSDELTRLSPDTAYILGGPASVPINVPRLVQKELGVCWAGKPPVNTDVEAVKKIYGMTVQQIAYTLDMGGRLDGGADIVRYLIDNQVCTTFFPTSIMADTSEGREILGLIAAHPELFEVGNHTVHHCDLVNGGGGSPTSAPCQRSMTDSFIRSELSDAESVLKRLSGMPIRPYWRPPFGVYDSHVQSVVAGVGYPKTMMWSRDTIDWDPATTTQDIIDAVLDPTPETGTIVLSHLGGYHTGEALKTIVPTLRSRGMTLTTISDMWDH